MFDAWEFGTIVSKPPKVQYEKMEVDPGFGEGWDSRILTAKVPSIKDGSKDSTLHAEVWTSYPNDSSDCLVGGIWLVVPDDVMARDDYHFGAFAYGSMASIPDYADQDSITPVAGKAVYKGAAAGLHSSLQDGATTIRRLLGKVTIDANFGTTSQKGAIGGRIDDLTLDGEDVRGKILLQQVSLDGTWYTRPPKKAPSGVPRQADNEIGNIDSINYEGSWSLSLNGAPPTAANKYKQPTGAPVPWGAWAAAAALWPPSVPERWRTSRELGHTAGNHG